MIRAKDVMRRMNRIEQDNRMSESMLRYVDSRIDLLDAKMDKLKALNERMIDCVQMLNKDVALMMRKYEKRMNDES